MLIIRIARLNFITQLISLKILNMDVKDKTKGVEEVKKNKVRITLTCRNMKSVEKGNTIIKSLF